LPPGPGTGEAIHLGSGAGVAAVIEHRLLKHLAQQRGAAAFTGEQAHAGGEATASTRPADDNLSGVDA
jgi:hypothetical protein